MIDDEIQSIFSLVEGMIFLGNFVFFTFSLLSILFLSLTC